MPKLLSELRSEGVQIARPYEIQRVQGILREVGPNQKFTPGEILEKLQAAYDPSLIQIEDSVVKWGRAARKDMPYPTMDNPWKESISTMPDSGFSIIMRMPDSGAMSEDVVKGAQNAITRLSELPSDNMATSSIAYPLFTRSGLNDFAQPFIDALDGNTSQAAQRTLSRLESMRRSQLTHDRDAKKIYDFKDGIKEDVRSPRGFNEEKNRLLQVGGLTPPEVLRQAYVNAFSYSYENRLGDLLSDINIRSDQLPVFDSRTAASPIAIENFFKTEVTPVVRKLIQRAQKSMEDYAAFELEQIRDDPELRGLLGSLSTKATPVLGSNPEFTGKPGHTSVTGGLKNIISFTRASEVTSDIPGMGPAKGIYVHELQSDLANRVREMGGPRTLNREELEKRLAAADKGYNTAKQNIKTLTEKIEADLARKSELTRLINSPQPGDIINPSIYPEVTALEKQFREDVRARTAEERRQASFSIRMDNILERLTDPKKAASKVVDETFLGMDTNPDALQQMLIKGAVGSALNKGLDFVALTSLKYSAQPQLYKRLPENAQTVVRDLGDGFEVKEIELKNDAGPFKTLGIVWNQSDASGREGVNRLLTQGVPFKDGGEVSSAKLMLDRLTSAR
jgi:hypothetical protein